MGSNNSMGSHFESLSQEEMDFVTGADGGAQLLSTPTILISVGSATLSAASGFVSGFAVSAYTRCRD